MDETLPWEFLKQRSSLQKALCVGISSYDAERSRQAAAILRELGTPLLIHQPSYSLLDREVEDGLLDVLADVGAGAIVFSPLAQGLLTAKYLDGLTVEGIALRQHASETAVRSKLARARQAFRLAFRKYADRSPDRPAEAHHESP